MPEAAVAFPVNFDFAMAEIEGDTEDASSDSLAYFEAGVFFARRHRIVLGGFDATYSRTATGGADRELRIRNLQLLYGFDLLDDRQKTVSVQAGLHLDLDGDGYSGRQMFASFGVFHKTFPNVSLGAGYVFNRVALRSGVPGLAERIEPLHQGPSLLVTASF